MKNMDIYLNSPSNVTNTLHYLVTRSIIAIPTLFFSHILPCGDVSVLMSPDDFI